MRIAVIGAKGLLGRRIVAELIVRGHDTIGLDHSQLDITDWPATQHMLRTINPELVIHSAGMTNVDRCADLPDLALSVNGFGTQNIAVVCQEIGAILAYVSTNEVFDGTLPTPYLEYDVPRPINPYGYSKWVGEQAVQHLIPRHYIIRTSWMFAHGGENFLHRLVRAASQGDPISVVIDEVASPTYADDLAVGIARLVETGRFGVYHLVNNGSASRYQFARTILDCAGYAELPIAAVISAQRPRRSRPPAYATLRNFAATMLGIELRPWQESVRAYFAKEYMNNEQGHAIRA